MASNIYLLGLGLVILLTAALGFSAWHRTPRNWAAMATRFRRCPDITPVARTLIIEGIHDGVLLLDDRGLIADINPAAMNMLGMDPSALGQDAQRRLAPWPELAQAIGCHEKRHITIASAGTPTQQFAGQVTPLHHRGEFCGQLLLLHDVTAEKLAEDARRECEAAEAANRAKSLFLANMSHEIRTPLNAILGFAQVLGRDTGMNDTQRGNLASIRRSGEHLLNLIDDILDLAKIEAGKVSLQIKPIDLKGFLGELGTFFQHRAKERGLSLTIHAEDCPAFFGGDEMRLRQVLINLLGNAIKFTPSGSVIIGVENLDGTQLRFSVTDTGYGIAHAEMVRLFQPFSQSAIGSKAREGTGLGLALSRQLVRLMGGELEVDSTPGLGSPFFFYIPFQTVENLAKPKHPNQPTVMGLNPDQPVCRILVVDDQPDNRAWLLALLESINPQPPVLELREASDGVDAVAVWESWQPHLIFMDLKMSAMSGDEATVEIKARMNNRADAVKSKVIALTASTLDEDRNTMLACGCDEFARKPFQAETLFNILQRQAGLLFTYSAEQPGGAGLTEGELVARLARYPATWRSELLAALDRGDSSRIGSLLDQIHDQDGQLHWALDRLAFDCNHEAMIALLGLAMAEPSNG